MFWPRIRTHRHVNGAAATVAIVTTLGWMVTTQHLRRARSQLWAARTDPVTRGLTRAAFTEQATACIADADRCWGVGLVDLDDFKVINDTRGHHVGDRVLAATARRLTTALDDREVLCGRWGGDEFALLIPGPVTIDDHTRLTRAINQPVDGVAVSASLGLSATCAQKDATLTTALISADHDMYRYKRQPNP